MTCRKYKLLFFSLAIASLFILAPDINAGQASILNTSQTKNTLVKGTVKDVSGEPLIGVSVSVKGKSGIGTITDINGNFSIQCDANDALVFSYIGYATLEFPVNGKSSLSISMKEDTKVLDEVIVVGYGTTTRKSAVGAVDQVKADMIENRPVANMTQALQGAAPNVIIQQRNHNPNDNKTNFNIRGISTLNDNSPLFVIDGLVADGESFNKLNPMDIENISILKDAGTAAIYGSRSSNGVVVVTTKKGKKNQRPVVRLSGMIGWENPDILFSPVAGYQNATLRNLAETNAGNAPKYTPDQIRDLAAHQNEESWFFDQIMRTAMQQNYNLSVSGGSEHSTYMISMGYYDQESNYVGNDSFGVQRYNFRTSLSTELGRFKLTGILAYARNNSVSTTGGSLEVDAARTPTYYYYKMKSADGRYLLNDILSEFNPLGQLEAGGRNKYRNNYINTNVSAEMKIIDGLKLKGVFGADIMNDTRFTRNHAVAYYSSEEATEPRPIKKENNKTSNWNSNAYLINTQLLLDYNKTFGKHTVNGLVGLTNESYTQSSNEIEKKYVDPDLGIATDETTSEPGNITGKTSVDDSNRTSITSFFGRAGYSYADRYYAEFSFRYDGASKFHKDYRWGFFPSVSLGWRPTEESFMEFYKEKIGDLKLRASYGILGSQAIGTYDRFTVYDVYDNSYAYNNKTVSGAGFKLGLENLTWEKTQTFNIGVDASFLQNSLTVTFDYFHKRTNDILMKPLISSVFGTEMPMANIGKMQNQGWDLSVNYRLKTGAFTHNFNFNLGDSWNKVLEFPGDEQITQVEELSRIIRVGVPLNSYYGYKMAGFFQSYDEIEASAIPVGAKVQPGDIKFVDRNDDGIIDSKDKFILGNAFPRYTFGFTYGLNWKGIDFSMFWQGVGKRDMMLRGELIEPYHANYSYTIYKHQLDFWTPTNTEARWPRLAAPGSDSNRNNYGNGNGSDLFLLDGKYLRLKNLTIGYTLPKEWTKHLGMQKARLYINGQNLLTFSNNSFIDPESSEFDSKMSTSGANSGRSYPTLRYFGFGVDIEF
ncbi:MULTISPECIES: TonB-dependent receptor [Bacteroidaceae]|jgi:TonB-linked SusC/RagA family outer membrane protein|uniref:SusC/RagA family TonB-linked outer membrane protein n=2 Tax=Bacteroides TaxID=816 RepID=A0A1C7H5W3_9BACE|nr:MULTISPECIES: TonB-dependent receptor [Bacteroidaceae]ANU59356.1 SusC/RagA family TonB-linked outer membrane protein [Bacteroides caecimuris]MCR1998713.1 TonB-dependent receptor [Bacteroides acidifaciens]NDO61617.1 TonB-dependent receptor [Bacteroides caecimuris]OXE63107.1 SusC/RagA family TonB-linked outer membrane protein [Bacteroides caecimuris]QQR15731.1 TonB-dependent receptor [Bacteroides caecimuris]